MLRDASTGLVPLGAIIDYTGLTAPNANFVIPIGQCISRTTYAAYFAMVGTTFGACDGSTTFGVIDLRGRVTAGLDTMGGPAAGRLTATYCTAPLFGAVCGNESQTLTAAQMPSHFHGASIYDPTHTHGGDINSGTYTAGIGGAIVATGGAGIAANYTGVRVWDGATLDRTALTGGGGAHTIVQPTIQVFKLLRVL